MPVTGPMLLDPGMDLTLRPMRYPAFYDRFRDAIRNTWTVEEVDLHSDLADLLSDRLPDLLPVARLSEYGGILPLANPDSRSK